MRRTLTVIVAVLCLSVPAALAAPPAPHHGKPASPGNSASAPGQSEDKNPAKKCKAMKKNNPAGFTSTYGTKPNAYGKCVSTLAKGHGSS